MPTASSQSAAKSQSGISDPLSTAVNVAAVIANTVAGIVDVAKRRQIESALMLMTAEEQMQLARDIQKQNNKNAQITILVNTVLAARNASADRAARTQTTVLVVLGLIAAVTILGVLWYKKKSQ